MVDKTGWLVFRIGLGVGRGGWVGDGMYWTEMAVYLLEISFYAENALVERHLGPVKPPLQVHSMY